MTRDGIHIMSCSGFRRLLSSLTNTRSGLEKLSKYEYIDELRPAERQQCSFACLLIWDNVNMISVGATEYDYPPFVISSNL